MESVSKLVAYSERVGEDAFSGHAKKRAQRIMHYNVSFRPFTATIQAKSVVSGNCPNNNGKKSTSGNKIKHSVSFEGDALNNNDENDDSESVSSLNSSGSVFMRTPTSFPPTPTSRLYYFERGSQVRYFIRSLSRRSSQYQLCSRMFAHADFSHRSVVLSFRASLARSRSSRRTLYFSRGTS